LKEIIRNKPIGTKEIENIEFGILSDMEGCNQFNLRYVQSINNIIKSIDGGFKSGGAYKKIIYVIENKEIMENEMVRIKDLERVVMELKKKHGKGNK